MPPAFLLEGSSSWQTTIFSPYTSLSALTSSSASSSSVVLTSAWQSSANFNKDVFDGGALTPDEITGACNTLPFMSEKRLVVIQGAERLKKAASEAIVSYLENPNDTTVLALIAEKLAKNTRLYKAIAKVDKKAVIDCAPRSARELPQQVQQFAQSKGVTITRQAAEELISLVGESTVHLDGELTKMAIALGRGALIDLPEVQAHVARVAEPKP